MITSIELGDFLSHTNTKLDFDKGVTVFVGHNGAGKSSIIDAITFALFGEHTRKSNKGLIKRGANQGFAKVNFTINGKEFQAERKVDSKGTLSAQFSEKVEDQLQQIAAGERKQFGESMTREIEKRIGLDFQKLKIASIVQQGELNSIIKAKPKEFKELLNAIIGIDKLDVASETIKDTYKEFRKKIQQEYGYDDTHIDILNRDLKNSKDIILESEPFKTNLLDKKQNCENSLNGLQKQLEIETPKIDKITQLESRKHELRDYVKEAIQKIQQEIAEKERKIHDCQDCFEHAEMRGDIETKLEKILNVLDETQKKIQKLTQLQISLKEKQLLAAKLQLKDDKCPVCDSKVKILNPLFQEKHLFEELKNIHKQISSLNEELELYNRRKIDFDKKLEKAKESEAILKTHSVQNRAQLSQIQKEIDEQKVNIPITSSGNLVEIAQLDSHTKTIFENIQKLEQETSGFNQNKFDNLKISITSTQNELSKIDQQLGAISEKINKAQENILYIEKTIDELKIVKRYTEKLNDIQSNVFSRDGPVATSLRSWALNTISYKASEYLTLLNSKIQRISLSEKTRDISIFCYTKNELLDLESLSGGEQVSIALALRLGMANLLGNSNLNLMILDEPTTHLDSDRRKALVHVLSQLTNLTNAGMPMQFIIITHDAEIFEDSTVEKIYKFESVGNNSVVTAL